MATRGIPFLVEEALVSAMTSDFANSMAGVSIYDALGAELMTFPSVRVEVIKGHEQPENSGNFLCDVEIYVLGRMDPANNTTYATTASDHSAVCGGMHEFITSTLAPSDLETNPESASNNIKVHSIRLAGFDRSINTAEAVFEDIFTLEIYLNENDEGWSP